ncbi:hypothetical protein FRB90_000716, partial [Tulasnella sp. 427]
MRPPAGSLAEWLQNNIPRSPEPVSTLKLIAVKRVISTSEDSNALVYAAVNLRAISSRDDAQKLLGDDELYYRLSEPWRLRQGVHALLSKAQEAQWESFSCALMHLALTSQSVEFFLPPDQRALFAPESSHSHCQMAELGTAIGI